MAFGCRRTFAGATVLAGVCLAGLVGAAADQAAAPQPPGARAAAPAGVPMAEQVFKNVQVLRGIPADEFMDTMGMFAAALGYDCSSCHSEEISSNRDAFAVTTPAITRARQMVLMMNNINRANFAGEPRVSCFTCHRGQYRPEIVPSLDLQYGVLMDDPNAMTLFPDREAQPGPVLDKYIQALGGAEALAKLTGYTATGTYEGFNTGGVEWPIEIIAKAPAMRAQVVTGPEGISRKVFDGQNGWAAEGWRPMPLMTFTGGNLFGARLEALLMFPAGLPAAFSQWIVSSTTIAEKPVRILQGANPGELPVNFYFDETGLLVRVVRWNRTAVGTVPTQVDFSDYRDVAGVKVPFKTLITWTDGQNTIALKDVRPNRAIDPAQFARPAPYQRTSR